MSTPDPAPTTPAGNVARVHALMQALSVSLADLELYGHLDLLHGSDVDDEDPDYTWPHDLDGAFNALKEAEFNLDGDQHAAMHYWDATRDHVADTLEAHGLRTPKEK